MKSLIKKFFGFMGYSIERKKIPIKASYNKPSPYSKICLKSFNVLDLEEIEAIGDSIPGMIASSSGRNLFTLCYFQQEKGDILEIGTWQGRSTVFLAYAALGSGNGKVWAVDHFKGNSGKEHQYVIEKEDLSDLKNGFKNNIHRAGLSSYVELLDMTNSKAARHIKDKSIRFLFIDGDHSKSGIEKDLKLFLPKLVDNAIIAFDDYSESFPGVVEVIDDLLKKDNHSQVMSYENTLIMRLESS